MILFNFGKGGIDYYLYNYNLNSDEFSKGYDFIFSDEKTLEVSCKVMDESYSYIIDKFSNHYSISKDGIESNEAGVSQ